MIHVAVCLALIGMWLGGQIDWPGGVFGIVALLLIGVANSDGK